MIEKTIQKAMEFIKQPENAFSGEKTTEISDAFLYMAILSIVSAVTSGIFVIMGGDVLFLLTVVIGGYIGTIVVSVIAGLWLHLWAYIFGANKGLKQTFKCVFYSGTPGYILGGIPYIGTLASLWVIYLNWLGLKTLHGMKGDKAAIAVVISFVIPLLVGLAFLLMGLAFLSAYGGGIPPELLP